MHRLGMDERLQKMLARAGLGSRRLIECWIAEGRVTVNGRTAVLGDRATAGDTVCVDGKPVVARTQSLRVLMYHKPEGVLASRSDPSGRPTLFEDLPPLHGERWIHVGRLDLNTSGLLIITNHGELAHRLMHPRYEFEREYLVRVRGRVSPADLAALQTGVPLDGELARFERLEEAGGGGSNRWYRAVLREGRYREVRRLWAAVGAEVSRLIRVRFGPVILPRDLPRGRWRDLDKPLREALLRHTGLSASGSVSHD